MTKFTVLGSSGFIGSRLVEKLATEGTAVDAPPRDASLAGLDLGHVVYCVGVTADFRTRLLETVEAHVCHLVDLLRGARTESFTYLSSTRVYQVPTPRACEEDALVVSPSDPDHLYNISKILGEAVVLGICPAARVVRLSNVYGLELGSANFLASVITSALTHGQVTLRTSLASAKDYVSLDDVVDLIPAIALHGRHRIYNIASGSNTTNREIADVLSGETGCTFNVAPAAPAVVSPIMDIELITTEFGFRPRRLIDDLPGLVSQYAERL